MMNLWAGGGGGDSCLQADTNQLSPHPLLHSPGCAGQQPEPPPPLTSLAVQATPTNSASPPLTSLAVQASSLNRTRMEMVRAGSDTMSDSVRNEVFAALGSRCGCSSMAVVVWPAARCLLSSGPECLLTIAVSMLCSVAPLLSAAAST